MSEAACSPVLWWWTIFMVILLSGLFGGFARYAWDTADAAGEVGKWWTYLVLGVMGAFMVPLFLSTLSSTLIQDAATELSKLFILIGFCLAAAAFSKQFVGSVSRKALQLAGQANEAANAAVSVASEAKRDARSADNRAIGVMEAQALISDGKNVAAKALLDELVEVDPSNAEARAWRAYCLKREGDLKGAIDDLTAAMASEGRPVYRWFFNLACYKALALYPAGDVVDALESAKSCATESQMKRLAFDLSNDPDFDTVRSDQAFISFLESVSH